MLDAREVACVAVRIRGARTDGNELAEYSDYDARAHPAAKVDERVPLLSTWSAVAAVAREDADRLELRALFTVLALAHDFAERGRVGRRVRMSE